MQEKDEPVQRDIDERNDPCLADVKEKKSSEDSHQHRDVKTRLCDALHTARDAALADAGEVVERKSHNDDAKDDVQIDQDGRTSRCHRKEELDKHDPDHRVQSHP